jgi:DNA polymerase-3 subunit delta
MAATTVESVVRQFGRAEFLPVYYLTGEEETLKEEFIDQLVAAALEPATRDFDLDVRQASELSVEDLSTLVETVPVFAPRRVVVIKGVEQWRKNSKLWEALYRYVDRPSPTTVLVVTQAGSEKPDSKLARCAAHLELEPPSGDELAAWIEGKAASLGLRLERSALDHLLAVTRSDLAQLKVELQKLAAAFGSDQIIGEADVSRLVGVRRGETLEDWLKAALERDRARALELIDVVLPQAGVSGVRMVTALGQELLGLRLARALLDRGTAPSRLAGAIFQALLAHRPKGLGDWRLAAQRWSDAAARWSSWELDAAIAAAYDADRSLKSTTVSDDRAVVSNLILTLGALSAQGEAA